MRSKLYSDIPEANEEFVARLEHKLFEKPQFSWYRPLVFFTLAAIIIVGVMFVANQGKGPIISHAEALERIEATYKKYVDPSKLVHSVKRLALYDNSGKETENVVYDYWYVGCGESGWVNKVTYKDSITYQYGNRFQNFSYSTYDNEIRNELYGKNMVKQLADDAFIQNCTPSETMEFYNNKAPWTVSTDIKEVEKNGKKALMLEIVEKDSMTRYYYFTDNYAPYITEMYKGTGKTAHLEETITYVTLDLLEPTDENLAKHLDFTNFFLIDPATTAIYEKLQTGETTDDWKKVTTLSIVPIKYHVKNVAHPTYSVTPIAISPMPDQTNLPVTDIPQPSSSPVDVSRPPNPPTETPTTSPTN